MKTSIVIGLQYGDEGKGLIASSLVHGNDLVVRFNGGHQAGHTVVKNGHKHVFSSFGSGTLNGADTYWSEYCTFYPKSYYNELKVLEEAKSSAVFGSVYYVHPMAMVTTPFDIDHNRKTEDDNKHGSVGMGFGATIARNENTPYKLYVIDLTHRSLLVHKLWQIANWYNVEKGFAEKEIATFLKYVDNINLNIRTLSDIKYRYNNIVFEGAQGVMLDMDLGFFPNVTRSNTTTKNAMKIIKEHRLPAPQIYYAMRSYLTRHGNGFMPNECADLKFDDETNKSHRYQGDFRQGYHSIEQLQYAINADCAFSGTDFTEKNLAITCLDQTSDKMLVDNREMGIGFFLDTLGYKFDKLITTRSPSTEGVQREILRKFTITKTA